MVVTIGYNRISARGVQIGMHSLMDVQPDDDENVSFLLLQKKGDELILL